MNLVATRFLFEESSPLDDSNIEEFLITNDIKNLILVVAMKEHEDGKKQERRGSTVGGLHPLQSASWLWHAHERLLC
jgi:hypothetical protein